MPSPTQNRPWRAWYSERAWFKLRSHQLKLEPSCRFCRQAGVYSAAEIVDHVQPHKGKRELFFAPANLQSLCKRCHDSTKQQAEKRGYDTRIGLDGLPVDRNHPFFR